PTINTHLAISRKALSFCFPQDHNSTLSAHCASEGTFPHRERLVRRFKRVHYSGTKAKISQHSGVWRVEINLREAKHHPMMITDYVPQSLALAKELADKEIAKYGHVCNKACKDWIEVL